MNRHKISCFGLALALLGLVACSDDGEQQYKDARHTPMTFTVTHPSQTRATASPINLTFKHIMSKIKIRLIKGEDFEGEMPATADVYIHNTVPTATVDLQAGVATRYVKGTKP